MTKSRAVGPLWITSKHDNRRSRANYVIAIDLEITARKNRGSQTCLVIELFLLYCNAFLNFTWLDALSLPLLHYDIKAKRRDDIYAFSSMTFTP